MSLLAVGCAAPDFGSMEQPIINGRPSGATEHPWTVAIYNSGRTTQPGLCTGTIIGPRVILTAKHCVYGETPSGWIAVPPGDFLVFEGTNLNVSGGVTRSRGIREWRSTSGTYRDSDLNAGRDIAVIIVDEPFEGIEFRGISRATPARNAAATIVGFGRNNPATEDSGVKYFGNTTILDFNSRLIQAGGASWTCQGDSGGPLLVGNTVVGVTSFGVGGCGRNSGHFFVDVAAHQAMIDEALAFVPPCEPSDEVCDGEDNNCDGVIDEGCVALGNACSSPIECGDGLCEPVDGTNVCVRECDPRAPLTPCPFGFHCGETGCGTGWCVRGTEGSRADGELCDDNTQCYSRRCIQVGDAMRCSRQCETNCEGDLICEDRDGCNSCVRAEDALSPRAFGNVCDEDSQCLSGDCTEGEGASRGFCTASCAADNPCPSDYHCRGGRCVAGPLRSLGEDCITGEDCQSGLECADVDGENVCVGPCDENCPMGFECSATGVGDRCVLGGLPLGEICLAPEECRSGICLGTCTRICEDIPCPDHLECRPAGPVSGCFPRDGEPEPPTSSGGCAMHEGGASPFGLGTLGFVLAFGWIRRRRS